MSDSSNWAGYAVHAPGVSFEHIAAQWRQPRARCVAGRPTYSAAWIGLGGFSDLSTALEQIGTEVDCGMAGRVLSSAWFELVPESARTIRLRVRPGDLVAASVTVAGAEVAVALTDRTRGRTFRKTLRARTVDLSSAEWIVEAPSDCISTSCRLLPLADFGSEKFRSAQAMSTTGVSGSVTNPAWSWTKIRLRPPRTQFSSFHGRSQAAATPLALTAGGSSFKVVYSRLPRPNRPKFVGPDFLPSTAGR